MDTPNERTHIGKDFLNIMVISNQRSHVCYRLLVEPLINGVKLPSLQSCAAFVVIKPTIGSELINLISDRVDRASLGTRTFEGEYLWHKVLRYSSGYKIDSDNVLLVAPSWPHLASWGGS